VRRAQLITVLIFVLAGGIVLIWSRGPAASQKQSSLSTPDLFAQVLPTPFAETHRAEEVLAQQMAEGKRAQQQKQAAFLQLFNTPISFWGKVVDEKGDPVSNATVELGTADRPWEEGASYERITDEKGLFSITDVKGLSISVDVSKDGYYKTSRSRGQFSYAQPSANKVPLPTPDNPTVFELRKTGQFESLVHVDSFIKVPRDGTPVDISLETGRPVAAGDGALRVEAWTNDQLDDPQGHYDWRCRISVPDGGLTERKGEFDFEAPANGYRPSDEINMPRTAESWSPQVSREYFLKLADGRYARIRFEMVAGGDNFISIHSYLNPKLGHRNLECDPDKTAAEDK
jgi:Carboxypeptidase regulatory-like domain